MPRVPIPRPANALATTLFLGLSLLTSVSGCQNGAPAKSSTRPSAASPLRSSLPDVVNVPMSAGAGKRPHHTRPVKLAGQPTPHVVHPHTDSATLFTIVINGAALVNQPLVIDAIGTLFDSNTPESVQLAAGTYNLRSYALGYGIVGSFTVNDDGTLDYDSSLDNKVFSGRTTSTLTLIGYPVTIDASALTAQSFVMSYVG